MEEEKLLGISLSISPESDDVHVTSVRTRERWPFISISRALIYISYIYKYIYTLCCFVLKEERQFCKTCTSDCSFFLSLPFMMSTKHSGLKWGEKSDLSFKSNQVNEVSIGMIGSMKDLCLFVLSGLDYFWSLSSCESVQKGPFKHLEP